MNNSLYNPKANAPAVYIPAWLIQIPNSELHYSSKLVYGRLAQWANSSGKAHRSAAQLSEELGMSLRTVERCLQELRDKKLIGTYLIHDGGHNNFEFYNHEWMHREINKNLCYETINFTPSAKMADPSAKMADPSAKMAVHINNNKYKEIKDTTTASSNSISEILSHEIKKKPDAFALVNEEFERQTKIRKFREEALSDDKCIAVFNLRFSDINITLEELYEECVDYWSQKNQMVFKARFLTHLKRVPLEKYQDYQPKKVSDSRVINSDEINIINDYVSNCRAKRTPPEELKGKIEVLKKRLELIKTTESREIISSILKAEEILCSANFNNIIKSAATRDKSGKNEISQSAIDNLSEIKKKLL